MTGPYLEQFGADIEVLGKPEDQRTLEDVKKFISFRADNDRKRYESVDMDPERESVRELYFDMWSEIDDAQKGLEGKAPISRTIDYLRKREISLTSIRDDMVSEAPASGLFQKVDQQVNLTGGIRYVNTEIGFYKQAIKLVTADWEMKRKLQPQQESV